jgi:hypothetical protein
MNTKEYQTNRARVPRGELARCVGQWVAFSLDGRRVVGGDEELERLGEGLRAAGVDLQQVVFEYIPGPGDDSSLDGVESVEC